jgi:galactokinase
MRANESTSLPEYAVVERFRRLYGAGAMQAMRAPARINILGEHVDYVSYLPTASLAIGSHEHAMWLLWRATNDGQIRGASTDERFVPFSFAVDELGINAAQPSWEAYLFNRPLPAPDWSNYVRGAVTYARWQHRARIKRGFSFLIDSTIPPNSGASSSSALVVLSGAAIRLANEIEFQLAELARASAQAEWFMGTRGGALDHTTICLAQPGHALHIAHSEERTELLPIPIDQFRWLTFFSHPADKGRAVMLEYNERAAVSRLLIPAFINRWREAPPPFLAGWRKKSAAGRTDVEARYELAAMIHHLPKTITLGEFARDFPSVFAEFAATFPALVSERGAQPFKLRARALHHLAETQRVAGAVEQLQRSDAERPHAAMRVLGQMLNDSHASLRDLYEVSTPEVEQLVAIIRGDAQVYGARLMGGGFGGNVLALTTAANVSSLIARVQAKFYEPQNHDGVGEGAVMVSTPGAGLSILGGLNET